MTVALDPACSACGSRELTVFFDLEGVPALVCEMWPDAESARACRRGDLRLCLCAGCGLIENVRFEPEKVLYAQGYENSLEASAFFRDYVRVLAEDLVRRHVPRGGRVVEIGCGDGNFLELVCELGACEGVGFDPSYPRTLPEKRGGGRVRFVRELFTGAQAGLAADLVVCRQVLEHVSAPLAFLAGVRDALAGGDESEAKVLIEVPNVRDTLRRTSLWDVIYEHCTYFGRGTLSRLLARAGFDVRAAHETYAGQFIAVEATPARGDEGSVPPDLDDTDALLGEQSAFAAAWRPRVDEWRERLEDAHSAGRTVALWGAGARGVTFLNVADPERRVALVVDKNTRKHGRHVAGSGQPVVPPQVLVAERPELVILMNPNYEAEIRAELRELGLAPEVRVA